MIRKEAINIISKKIGNQSIISANGFISRDLFEINDRSSNFYMIGSMGLATSIGLGIALKKLKKRVYVFDGDGNILMNLGSIITIGSLQPNNLVHIIFDNKIHESTGGQPTRSDNNNISKIAKISNYSIFTIKTKKSLETVLKKIDKINGPIMIHIHVTQSKERSSRVKISPEKIKSRFMSAIKWMQ